MAAWRPLALLTLGCCLVSPHSFGTETLDCPEGSKLAGDAPPKGRELRCEDANGQLQGPYKRWYGNGQLNQQMTYKNGQEQGAQRAWWPNGKPMMEGVSVEGKRNSGFKYWDMMGNPIEVQFKSEEIVTESP